MLKEFLFLSRALEHMYDLDNLKLEDKKWYKNHVTHKSKVKRKKHKKGKNKK